MPVQAQQEASLPEKAQVPRQEPGLAPAPLVRPQAQVRETGAAMPQQALQPVRRRGPARAQKLQRSDRALCSLSMSAYSSGACSCNMTKTVSPKSRRPSLKAVEQGSMAKEVR